MATAISASTVHTVLDYLCPLAGPVPPHLLSRPLLQRHHFLAISPENAADYLAWPSPDQSHAVQLLQSQPIPSQDHSFPVNYTADAESLVAHIRITPDLRLLFLWDNTCGWQYHNVALMPFPADSYSSFEQVLSAYSAEDFLPEPSYSVEITAEEDDDSYWNSYGGSDDSEHLPVAANGLEQNLNSEDAYWAQYASVQGSGDSTLPSPHPEKRKIASGVDIAGAAPERVIIPSDDLQINHRELYNPLEPPEPSALARRLEALSAGSDPASPLSDGSQTTSSTATSPEALNDTLAEQSTSSPSSTSSASTHQRTDGFVVIDSATTVAADPAQAILRDSIKGIYQLWKLGKQNNSDEDDKELFLASVRQALDQL